MERAARLVDEGGEGGAGTQPHRAHLGVVVQHAGPERLAEAADEKELERGGRDVGPGGEERVDPVPLLLLDEETDDGLVVVARGLHRAAVLDLLQHGERGTQLVAA